MKFKNDLIIKLQINLINNFYHFTADSGDRRFIKLNLKATQKSKSEILILIGFIWIYFSS